MESLHLDHPIKHQLNIQPSRLHSDSSNSFIITIYIIHPSIHTYRFTHHSTPAAPSLSLFFFFFFFSSIPPHYFPPSIHHSSPIDSPLLPDRAENRPEDHQTNRPAEFPKFPRLDRSSSVSVEFNTIQYVRTYVHERSTTAPSIHLT